MGFIIEFKPVVICSVRGCRRKHYAKGCCEKHYKQYKRENYRYTLEDYSKIKSYYPKKVEIQEKLNTRSKPAKELYHKIKESHISIFQYKDIMDLMDWKYKKVQKHILKLVKLRKLQYHIQTAGGRLKNAVFQVV